MLVSQKSFGYNGYVGTVLADTCEGRKNMNANIPKYRVADVVLSLRETATKLRERANSRERRSASRPRSPMPKERTLEVTTESLRHWSTDLRSGRKRLA